MASSGDEDALLSDVEDDEPVPIVIKSNAYADDLSPERFRELLTELDSERKAREKSENLKSELQGNFHRFKVLIREAIKARDEAIRSNQKLSADLAEASRVREEALKERDEVARRFEEAARARDGLRSEIESCAHMLERGIEKISEKVRNFKNFSAEGLPRSQKYSGFPAVAFGVIKRTNDIVEELVNQINNTSKSRNEAREQMEQRNYEIAIEVSQLEASICGLKDKVEKKNSVIESFEKAVAEKDWKVSEMERQMPEKEKVIEYLETKMGTHKNLLVDQLNYVSKIHDQIYNVIEIVDARNSDHSEFSKSLFLQQETDTEENIRACLAGMEFIYELTRILFQKTRGLVERKGREVKSLNETVSQLVKEKEQIGCLLRGALSKRMISDPSSRTSELFNVARNGFKFTKLLGDGRVSSFPDKENAHKTEDETYTLAGALESIVKTSQLEIIDLQHSVEELRAESSLLREHVEAQAKELNHRKNRVEELEEKERMANESVEGLMTDITFAEDEITRWKRAAAEEAAAGRAVEQEFLAQLAALRQELEEAKQAMLEADKKLRFKEETATAAMEARDAAEKSLRLQDTRTTRLRGKVEELTRQLEEFESREDLRGRNGRARYVCWPWQWLGIDFIAVHQSNTEQQGSNEMELSEPFL